MRNSAFPLFPGRNWQKHPVTAQGFEVRRAARVGRLVMNSAAPFFFFFFFDIHAQMCFWRPSVTWFISDPVECDGRGEIGTIRDCISRPDGKKNMLLHTLVQ